MIDFADRALSSQKWWRDFMGRLETFPMFRRIVSNIGWGVVERVIGALVSVVVGIQVARYLGPGRLGWFLTACAFVQLLTGLSDFGMRPLVVKRLLEKPEEKDATLGSAALLILLTSLAAYPLVALAGYCVFGGGTIFQLSLVVALCWFTTPLQNPQMFWFQARLSERYNSWALNGGQIIAGVFRLLLIYWVAGVEWFAVALLFESVCRTLIRHLCYRRSGESVRKWRVSVPVLKELFRAGWPLAFALIAEVLYFRLDVLMLNAMAGAESAGTYGAASRLSEFFYCIPIILGSSLFPSIMNAKQAGETLYRNRMKGYLRFSALAAYLLAGGLTLAAGPVVHLLYGEPFAGSASVLMIHAWAMVPYFVGWCRQEFATAEGFLKLMLPLTLVGAALNAALNIWLIPHWAEKGAAVATLISMLVVSVGASFLFRSLRGFGICQVKALLWPFPSLKNLAHHS